MRRGGGGALRAPPPPNANVIIRTKSGKFGEEFGRDLFSACQNTSRLRPILE